MGAARPIARSVRFLALAAVFAGAAPASAASALAETLRVHRDAQRLDVGRIAALYDEAILTDAGIGRTVERLRVFAGREDRPPRELANIRLIIAHLLWRHGDPDAALATADQALATLETADGLLLKGRLLDAKGDAAAAADWYQRAIAASDSSEEKEFLRLRLTMAQASERNVDALARLASEGDEAYRNRAAGALGILGHPAKALEIYQAGEDFGTPFRQHVRLAEWAIAAADWPRAQAEAWRAVDAAGPRADALYALAILVEAHRGDDALGALLAAIDDRMAEGGADNADLARTRVDLLIETERYDDAIAFYETVSDAVDMAARRRLIQLYEAAGRPEDMVAEYQRLIAAEPAVVGWYASLAGHYMNVAAEDQALAVWANLEARNADRLDVLLEGGERMIDMGFVQEALAMIERHMAQRGESAPALLFLFEAHFARGRNADALAALERLEAILPPADAAVRDLADAYERLQEPGRAVRLLEALRDAEGGLGYDERVRLAWLYSVSDRKADALAAWRALWLDVSNAARRALAEDQLMLLAAETNVLADLVVELEDKLYAGAADRNEMNLLVRIYTEVGDALSATEIIDEYAKQADVDEVARLRRLGHVYRMLADFDAYDDVLRTLVGADPDNEVEHVQNIVLNMLAHDLAEDSIERFGEIQRWLEKLRDYDDASVAGEFEAGILAMGGFADEAIKSYRRALAEQPQNSDNLLLLADLMKSSGRRDEAVALLQYAAEHAVDDNAFVVAVDGIINMIGARSFTERLTPALRDIFRWTHRIILERIVGGDGKFYLYRLLADIAQETGDSEGEFLALENALSLAGLRRPAVLRELVTLATPNTGFGGFSTGGGDRSRRIIHGRRLIGLRQALPPEVYIDLGKVLLESGELAGAEQAFDRIDDITGLIDIHKTKADLLHEAGYPARALGYYARALNVNRDDVALLARTAMLREVRGQDDVANRLYHRALTVVLRGLAVTRPSVRPGADRSPMAQFGMAPDTSVSRAYRTYFEWLAQGLLVTWPSDAAAQAERVRSVRELFDEALAAVPAPEDAGVPKGQRPLAEFPRLHRTAEFAQRVAERIGNGEEGAALTAHLDTALAGFAGQDAGPEADEGGTSLLGRQLAHAAKRGDFEGVVRLATLLGDDGGLAERLRAHVAAGNIRAGLGYAWRLLAPAAFERFARPLLPTLQDHPAGVLALIGLSTDLALAMEERLGADMIAPDALLPLLESSAAKRFFASPRNGLALDGIWRYAQAKLTLDAQIAVMARTMERDGGRGFTAPAMLADLLAKPLDDAQRAALAEAANAFFGQMDDLSGPFGREAALHALLVPNPHPGNVGLLYDLARSLERRAQFGVDVAAALKDIYEGEEAAGFAAVVRLSKAGLVRFYFIARAGLSERFAGEQVKIFDRVRAGEPVDAATARFAYEMEVSPFYEPNRDHVALTRHFVAAYPDDSSYREQLVLGLLLHGERAAAEEAFEDYVADHKHAELARAALYFHYLAQGQYGAALDIATDGPDLRDPTVVDALVEKARRGGRESGSGAQLFAHLYPQQAALGFNAWSQSPTMLRDLKRLRELAAAVRDGDEPGAGAAEQEGGLASTLRAVWRGAGAPGDENALRYRPDWAATSLLATPLRERTDVGFAFNDGPAIGTVEDLLDTDARVDENVLLFDVLADAEGTVAALDGFARALPENERRDASGLYRLLAQALAAEGASARRESDLAQALREGAIGDHDFALWMALRLQEGTAPDPDLHGAFAARFAAIAEPTGAELVLAARLHALAGAMRQAAEHYRAVAAGLIRHREFEQPFFLGREPDPNRPNCAKLLAEVAERLPPAAAEAVARSVLAIAAPAEDHPAYDAYLHALALRGLGAVLPPAQALTAAESFAPDSSATPAPPPPDEAPRALELIRLQARAGQSEAALRNLRAFLSPEAQDPEERFRGRPHGLYALPDMYGIAKGAAPMALLVAERERVFPSRAADAWPGAQEWTRRAATTMLDWLDEAENADVRANAVEMLLLASWQLHQAGARPDALRFLGEVAERAMRADAVDGMGLRNLTLLALRVGYPLPAALAERVVAQGALTARQEVALIEALVEAGETDTALRVGQGADRGHKWALMHAVMPLAEVAGEQAYAADLAARINEAARARGRLGIPPG